MEDQTTHLFNTFIFYLIYWNKIIATLPTITDSLFADRKTRSCLLTPRYKVINPMYPMELHLYVQYELLHGQNERLQ